MNFIIKIIQNIIKKIFYLIYKVFYFIDIIFNKIIKKRFLYWFREFLEEDSYKSIEIENKKLNFFIPNEITNWRVHTFFTKEPETLNWIDSFSGDKIVFWDIGANIGLYSIYAASKHSNIEIISFEPSVNNLRILSRNIYKNKLVSKIKIFQLPLSDDKNIFSSMNEAEFTEGWSMSAFGETTNYEGLEFSPKHNYQIFGTNINYLLDNKFLPFPNYIKIDVDGLEHKILNGANKFLNNPDLKSLLIELNRDFSEQFDTVQNIMKTNNFKSYLIDQNKKKIVSNFIFKK